MSDAVGRKHFSGSSLRRLFFCILFACNLVVPLSRAESSEYHGNLHCQNDSEKSLLLRQQGPLLALGASVSSALFADEFPEIVAKQMCLKDGVDYFYRFSFFNRFYHPTLHFMKQVFKTARPKIILALDHLYHRFKNKVFNEETRKELDRRIAHLVLDCHHQYINCSDDGEFQFVRKEHYRPIVILGDLFYDQLVDCSKFDRLRMEKHRRQKRANRGVQCEDDNIKLNNYLRVKEREYPNLFLVSVKELYTTIRKKPHLYHYDMGGIKKDFHMNTLFFDGFHPWTDPGAYVLANIVIDKINTLIKDGAIEMDLSIPYVKITKEDQ
ncbi:MAG: hypothetical protein ACE5FY_00705 [Nitrospiria bacterium]